MIIKLFKKDETALYAAEELKKYLDIIHPEFCEKIVFSQENDNYITKDEIKLGLLSDFSLDTSDVHDEICDDVVYIDVKNGSGIIAGSNIRSILLSVYAYLKAAGCVFLRPGDDGEIIPERDMSCFSHLYRKKADFSFRGECIEGAVSFEHVRDTIIWSPKVGMNLFMIQQIIPYNLMSRWYKHTSSTFLKDENVSFEEVGEMIAKLEPIIKKCGLQLHAPGHGYLLEPYGIHYKTINDDYELTEEARQDIAVVGGKRELFLGSPNFTQLCYSNPKIRRRVVDWLVGYVQKKPHIDFLQVWLADSYNNHCECENCIKERVSDLYVKLLNELDEELTRLNLDTKVVFLLYIDTLWAPLYEKIRNPSRFYMMAAIGGRDFSKPYNLSQYESATPTYVKNKYSLEQSFPLRMKFIEDWKPFFNGPIIFFEYHMYIQQYNDPGFMFHSGLWHDDIKCMDNLGISGMISCQTQRSFFPNGLPVSVFSATMFDKETDFKNFTEEYFKSSYGEDYVLAKEYLTKISELINPEFLQVKLSITDLDTDSGRKKTHIKQWVNNPQAQAAFKEAMSVASSFGPVAKDRCIHPNATIAKSWKLLWYHTDFCHKYAEILLTQSLGDEEKAKKLLAQMTDAFSVLEPEISAQFDLFLFDNSVKRKLS
ncbi:MAG: DUF4838 domain-containing protein [Ruminococcaceae bacterium]|nr:DUF4838 domain-containing protein [Oscillospiraceae bacterium]